MSKVAPHHCCGCQKIGQILCANCKNDIIFDRNSTCLVCLGVTLGDNLCDGCRVPYSRAWFVDMREGLLKKLIEEYKFSSKREAGKVLAELLDMVLPIFSSNVVVVPIPTISTHIRQRGFDHIKIVSRYFAKQRGLSMSCVVGRASRTKQLGADAKLREKQASRAFCIRGKINRSATYLLIDDVYTTGATVKYAAKLLKDAGAADVWVAVLSRQNFDK